jgi:low affinity Fe/Cu permease
MTGPTAMARRLPLPAFPMADINTQTKSFFQRFSQHVSGIVGSAWAFYIAVGAVIVWACFGPFEHYSEKWQLVINTGTTIVTFLMVFVIQNTQNRDNKALHLKLDELIRASKHARNLMMNLENCTDEELAELQREFERLRKREVRRASKQMPGEDSVCEGAVDRVRESNDALAMASSKR